MLENPQVGEPLFFCIQWLFVLGSKDVSAIAIAIAIGGLSDTNFNAFP